MQHLDDGTLHALVDGEIPSSELGPVTAHLETCDECRARLDEARAWAGQAADLVETIEVPAGGRGIARPGGTGGGALGRSGGRWGRPLGLAAAILLAVGLGYAGGALRSARSPAGLASPGAAAVVDPLVVATAAPVSEDAALRSATVGQEAPSSANEAAQTKPPVAPEGPPAEAQRAEGDQFRGGRRTLADSNLRLDEVVVTSASREERADVAKQAANEAFRKTERDQRVARLADTLVGGRQPAPAAPAAQVAARRPEGELGLVRDAVAVAPLTFVEAAARLGGRLRQIEGMVPARLEAVGAAVRLVYLIDQGELVLDQRRVADTLVVTLTGPLPADSLAKLRALVR